MEPLKNITYVPGVCNIGPEEINRRYMIGIVSLLIAIVFIVILMMEHINPWWRLLLFFPVALSAAGFIQARSRFCFAYANKGVFNLGLLGTTQKITDDAAMIKDKKKARQIITSCILIGIIVTIIFIII